MSVLSLFRAIIFKSECLLYQNKLSLMRRVKSPHLLRVLCLRERQRMKTMTRPKTTWWKLGTIVRWSVWLEGFTVFFFCYSHCFAPAVWDEQMSVESNRSIRLLQTPRCKKFLDQSHETYRLLRRKNLIVEAVRNFRIIEGLFPSVCLESYQLVSKHSTEQ